MRFLRSILVFMNPKNARCARRAVRWRKSGLRIDANNFSEVNNMRILFRQDQFDRMRNVTLAAIFLLVASAAATAQDPTPHPPKPAPRPMPDIRLSEGRDGRDTTPQDAPVSDKWATVYGVKIHYLEAGSGPVVMLLHGLGGDVSNWAPTIGPLSQRYRVIVPDQIGFGKSDKPLINYRVATLVDFLDGFYKQVGVTKASLVGNSLGGWTVAA